MAWSRMRFRGELVWVRVNAEGRLALDGGGRAEMKYRQEDSRVYRPSAANLTPLGPDEVADEPPAGKPASAKPARAAADAPRGAKHEAGGAAVVNVWTDGACSGNPGPMGIGVVVISDGERREHGEYLGLGTNNIAELVAIERGVTMATEGGRDGGRPIRLHTDSGYSIGVLSKGWKAKANQELIERLRRLMAAHPEVRLVKVAGHAGVPENERCDALAREAILRRGRA
jgi:ribonuclease HI